MTDDQFELASAYLDGAVTDEERARVEGDDELLALVRELRSISVELSDAPPASTDAREAAVTAALAEFDATIGAAPGAPPTEEMPATPVEIPPAPSLAGVDQSSVAAGDGVVVPLAPRRKFRFGHAVSVAAAAVVVLAGGIALFRDNAEAPSDDAVERQTLVTLSDDSVPAGAPLPPATTAAATTARATTATTIAAAADEPSSAEDAEVGAGDDEPGNNDSATEADAEAAAPPQLPAAPAPTEAAATTSTRPPSAAVPAPDEAFDEAPATLGEIQQAQEVDEAPAGSGDNAAAATGSAAEVAPSASVPTAAAPITPPTSAAAGAPMLAPSEPVRLNSRDEFAEFAKTLAEPELTTTADAADSSIAPDAAVAPELLPLDQAIARCLTPGSDPLASDAVYVDEDGTEHPVVVVIVGDDVESPDYGGLNVVTCTLIVDTAEPSLVTTTTSTTTSTTSPT